MDERKWTELRQEEPAVSTSEFGRLLDWYLGDSGCLSPALEMPVGEEQVQIRTRLQNIPVWVLAGSLAGHWLRQRRTSPEDWSDFWPWVCDELALRQPTEASLARYDPHGRLLYSPEVETIMQERDAAKGDAGRAVKIALKFYRGTHIDNRNGYKEVGMVDELKAIRERAGDQGEQSSDEHT